MSLIKTQSEISKIREAGKAVHKIIHSTGAMIRPGITTGELEDYAARLFSELRATSPCLGYSPGGHPPFPAWTCICVNNEIVHAIPGRRQIKEGDIVTVDVALELNGYIADSAWTFPVGKVSPQAERLLKVTKDAMYRGIAEAKAGQKVADIGYAIQRHAETNGFSVVRELVGHGVGRTMHEEPQVANYGKRGKGPALQSGMTFTIEPMINAGRKEIKCLDDGWTIVTEDGSLSAHFEHTVAIVPGGAMILTNGE